MGLAREQTERSGVGGLQERAAVEVEVAQRQSVALDGVGHGEGVADRAVVVEERGPRQQQADEVGELGLDVGQEDVAVVGLRVRLGQQAVARPADRGEAARPEAEKHLEIRVSAVVEPVRGGVELLADVDDGLAGRVRDGPEGEVAQRGRQFREIGEVAGPDPHGQVDVTQPPDAHHPSGLRRGELGCRDLERGEHQVIDHRGISVRVVGGPRGKGIARADSAYGPGRSIDPNRGRFDTTDYRVGRGRRHRGRRGGLRV